MGAHLKNAATMYDVIVIGAGIAGAAIARELSRYELKIAVLERSSDVANGTTKANSAIVHAGYDAPENSLMAKYNVVGNAMFAALCRDLNVPFTACGSLVVAFSPEDQEQLQRLHRRGLRNAVAGMRLISGQKARQLEPKLSARITGALLAETAGIVGPWELCIALLENAVVNRAELFLREEVLSIEKKRGVFYLSTNDRTFTTGLVINAAGVYADKIHNAIARPSYRIRVRRGQYFVMDKSQGSLVQRVIFRCPSALGKGILVAPTVHGNLLLGPDAQDLDDRENTATSAEELELIRRAAAKIIPDIQFRDSIRNFAGLRAESDRGDFVIEEAADVANFFDVGGMKSPGLTSAPAIAIAVAKQVTERLGARERAEFQSRRGQRVFMALSDGEKRELIGREPAYGRIICRCESITEGEIVAAIHRPLGARSLDGVKKRCRPGMGRCQGSFCGPQVQEILARELGLSLQEVMLDEGGSYILAGETKN